MKWLGRLAQAARPLADEQQAPCVLLSALKGYIATNARKHLLQPAPDIHTVTHRRNAGTALIELMSHLPTAALRGLRWTAL